MLELEDGYLLSHYRIENNSVVHAEWDSLQRAPPYASTMLSWLDPDYWCENQKQAKRFLKNLSWEQMVQQNWWGKLVWPAELLGICGWLYVEFLRTFSSGVAFAVFV